MGGIGDGGGRRDWGWVGLGMGPEMLGMGEEMYRGRMLFEGECELVEG